MEEIIEAAPISRSQGGAYTPDVELESPPFSPDELAEFAARGFERRNRGQPMPDDDGPKRIPSDTLRIDQAEIERALREAGGGPPPELVEVMRDAAAGPREEETRDECAACRACPLCDGTHMATRAQNAEWMRTHPQGT